MRQLLMTRYPIYSDLPGEPILDNDRVLVQRLVLDCGRSTGRPVHGPDHLQVFIKGGVLRSNTSGRATLWKDGRVVWHTTADPADKGSTNAGTASVEMVWVMLKPVAAPASPPSPNTPIWTTPMSPAKTCSRTIG